MTQDFAWQMAGEATALRGQWDGVQKDGSVRCSRHRDEEGPA